MSKNVAVVGGGIAGLAASLRLARAGHRVTIFEKRRELGGRAVTHLRQGYRFNLGPHAFYRGGAGARVLRDLGIPVRGGRPKAGGLALKGGQHYRLPAGIFSLLFSGLLSMKAKLEAAALLFRLRRIDTTPLAAMTTRQWLDANISTPAVRELMEALIRLATYSDHPNEQSAAAAVAQLQIATRGVIYVDEGWQKIVDSLHSACVAAGVGFVSSSRIVAVDHDGEVRGIELGGLEVGRRTGTLSVALPDNAADGAPGTRIPAQIVILAVDPATARELVPDLDLPRFTPVTATCLDVALSKLPDPERTFALGIDQPHYFSVHSAWAQLTPRGGALIHVAKYRKHPASVTDDELEGATPPQPEIAAVQQELESLLDELQPGWRDVLVHRRFLPSMTVSNALVTPGLKRPAFATAISGLYLAGDWVGDEGILSDAALASADSAARAIISAS